MKCKAKLSPAQPLITLRFCARIFFLCMLCGLVFFPAAVYAQDNPMQIPRTVFVGDPAMLIYNLPAAGEGDIVLLPGSPYFPTDPDIDFHRVVLERRSGGSRLIIDFTAFVPGEIKLPVISIGGESFQLSVRISSVIGAGDTLILSPPASALAMPGTALMIYGTMAGIAFSIILIIWFAVKGRTFLKIWIEKWKRRRLFVVMKKTERYLHKELIKGADKRKILDRLSLEFRNFLSAVAEDNNYRAMTAGEFKNIPCDSKFDADFLGSFFQRCDNVRFSGEVINENNIINLLDDLKTYITALYSVFNNEEKAAAL